MGRRIARISVVAAVLVASGLPAAADCWDVFGCSDRNHFRFRDLVSGPNCDFLWQMRNGIYRENGYCFKTARAIAAFGNDGCRHTSESSLPMNRIERANVATIERAEKALGCR